MIRSDYPIKGNYKKGNIEKGFMAEVSKFLRADWYFCYHVPDATVSYRLLDLVCISPKWDIILVEFKKINLYTFNMSQFEPSQIGLLNFMERVWAPHAIAIYSQATNSYVVTSYWYIRKNINDKNGIKLFNKPNNGNKKESE